MSELPKGWVDINIGEVADIVGGGTPKASDPENFLPPGDGISWLTPADLSGYKAKEISHGSRDLSEKGYKSCSASLMPSGSILFSSRAPIGYVAVASKEIATNQGFKSFVFHKSINPSYAYYYLKSIKDLANSRGTGTTFKELSGAAAKELPFRLAPMAEQARIAHALDGLLAQVDTLKARLDALPALIKRFRQSVLSAAVSGQLTKEWRLGKEYSTADVLLSDLIDNSLVGLVRSAEDQSENPEQGTPYFKMNNINNDWGISLESLAYVAVSKSETERYSLKYGDWLFNTRNSRELVGKSCVWRGDEKTFVFNNNILRARFSSRTSPHFIEIWFRSPLGRYDLDKVKSATTSVAAIYQKSLMSQTIPLPSLEEQNEIARRVELLFAFADQLEARLSDARARVDALTQSILAKAFRGELVPQDPADEPASVLLERITAQRANAPKPKRGRKSV